MLQDIKDEILESSPSYTIRDKNGNVTQDDIDIALKTPVIQEGTPINRALFRNLQGDLYTQDRYNKVNIAHEYQEVDYITDKILSEDYHQGDCIPKSWALSSGVESGSGTTQYIADTGEVLSYYRSSSSTSTAPNMVDGDENTAANLYMYNSTNKITIDFGKLIKVTKFKIKIPYVNSSSGDVAFVGSLDGNTWVDLYINIPVNNTTTLTEFEISNPAYYKHYGVRAYSGTGNYTVTISELQIVEYYDNPVFAIHKYIANLNLPLTSYENGKIVNIEGGSYNNQEGTEITSFTNPYLNINNLGEKKINGTIKYNEEYTLLYNGESWDIVNKPKVLVNYTLEEQIDSFEITDINEPIADGETFRIFLYANHNGNEIADLFLNGVAVLSTTNADGVKDYKMLECVYNADEEVIYVQKYNFSNDSYDLRLSRIQFDGTIRTLSAMTTDTTGSYPLYAGYNVKIVK